MMPPTPVIGLVTLMRKVARLSVVMICRCARCMNRAPSLTSMVRKPSASVAYTIPP
ncbi:Uncharacterised protein [Raoultella terrigena]|uniref:Uncharacterized protein n=1 Tax=Raoultella terrigena TaxID=577 RepID=A0A4U9CYC7_RAOTE|nr:Uncharacterised protein [Raoultella terrigena]